MMAVTHRENESITFRHCSYLQHNPFRTVMKIVSLRTACQFLYCHIGIHDGNDRASLQVYNSC